jgi:7-cyano-7-deazaguanine synthase
MKAVILLSGGLDSATVLAIAKAKGYECYTLSFDYGQRSQAELDAAIKVSERGGAKEHKVVTLNLNSIGGSALTEDAIAVPTAAADAPIESGIPVTYVPARNTIMLSIGLGWAEVLEASALFVGVNAVDYSGYPDCRPEYIESFQAMANLALKRGVEGHALNIETPLIDLTKTEIIQQGVKLGVDYSLTVSCYQADAGGAACGSCDSCRIRRSGFESANLSDPTQYQ